MSAGYTQWRIGLARPDVGEEEIEAVSRVLRTPILTNGPETAGFEREFADLHQAEHGVAFANGTVALVALYAALGIGPGDEVIVPSLTFVSSATSIVYAGATPVFADVDPDTFNLDPADVARKLSPRVKGILAVHYGGQPADLAELSDLAADAGVVLLEDAAEAHGARYRGRHVGTWGVAGMFSFTPTKNITTGEGGMVITGDGDLARRLRLLRNHGQVSPYEHAVLGCNWRLSEMQAAMGRAQTAKLDAILARKATLAAALDRHLQSGGRRAGAGGAGRPGPRAHALHGDTGERRRGPAGCRDQGPGATGDRIPRVFPPGASTARLRGPTAGSAGDR